MTEPGLEHVRGLLRASLSVAVPLRIMTMSPMSPDAMQARAQVCADEVAAHGDVLMFGARKGEAAEAFNRLAEGLALLAHCPGGVDFLGDHYEASARAVELHAGDGAAVAAPAMETITTLGGRL